MNKLKTSFIVFQIISSSDSLNPQRIGLDKQQEPYNGHSTYDDAMRWIENLGVRDVDYTIIEIIRTS